MTWVRKHRELTQITLMPPATTCWDPEFRCADLLVLLEVKQLAGRYSRHFLK